MLTFNFYDKEGTKEIHIDNSTSQFNFTKGDEIKFEHQFYKVDSVEFNVSEERVEQIVRCEPNE